ncbi:L,D-transpeptidase [Crocosphaera sp. Alani8]|uniref:L,D-transpeptidase n=1 Tax=Crocosphaera sp. Alani8 TaxID=3038952 RepID=UPI00313B865A
MLQKVLNQRIYCSRAIFRRLLISSFLLVIILGNLFVLPTVQAASPQQITYKMSQLKNSQKRWIEINLTAQKLTAWVGGNQVSSVIVSTGKPSTPTYPGIFSIQSKHRVERMVGSDYDVPNVPYAMYYHRGYAIHGAYWHNQFGRPLSHGCTNVSMVYAKWLFEWSSVGTSVIIHN